MAAGYVANKNNHVHGYSSDVASGSFGINQRYRQAAGSADLMSQEYIAIFMFASMLLMLMTGQRVFGAIGAIAAISALAL